MAKPGVPRAVRTALLGLATLAAVVGALAVVSLSCVMGLRATSETGRCGRLCIAVTLALLHNRLGCCRFASTQKSGQRKQEGCKTPSITTSSLSTSPLRWRTARPTLHPICLMSRPRAGLCHLEGLPGASHRRPAAAGRPRRAPRQPWVSLH